MAFLPARRLATSKARRLLPTDVPHADAAFNAGRAGLLVHALTSDPGSAPERPRTGCTSRSVRRPCRGPRRCVAKLRAAGVAAVVSGAGPTVLALASPDQVERVLLQAPGGWEAQLLSVAGGATAEGFRA